jgi:hypothetical protein
VVEGNELRGDLLARIAAKRACVRAHLRRHRPRSRRLTTATIVLTSLAAVFTAGPGVGGDDVAAALGKAVGTTSAPVWQGLCLGAALLSAAAAIVTGLSKSQEATAQLNTAAAVDCELEGLAFLLEFGEVPVEDAVKLYQQYITKINFIEDVEPLVGAGASGTASSRAVSSWAGPAEPQPDRVQADGRPPARGLPPVPPRPTSPRRLSPRTRTSRQQLPPPPRRGSGT